ncbi:acyl-CoA thioesterase [Bacillus sp. 165]|uniref:acyl-CoA thioesterase n=1 Tax=Bacillus sp. 165 TaxID=1529117 RepID=UPI001AD95544|nr:acyl-CoA thioesterase [Bacillus sp. 165]MBO9129009.1 acyl-CoA thioesterase [Bacillus sp. 165]
MNEIPCHVSRVFQTERVFPTNLNNHHTLFGGHILSQMDMTASISAARHCRKECVTASIDHVDFLGPVTEKDYVTYESFVVFTGRTSMVIFVKAVAENLLTGLKRIAATSFLTFVALENGKPVLIPKVVPETEEEKALYHLALKKQEKKHEQIEHSKAIASILAADGNI